MIHSCTLKNFGPLAEVSWDAPASVNLVLGGNGQGKTFLLKALYAALRSAERCGRGNENRPLADILAEKLHWTFQADKLGDLVRRKARGPLEFTMKTSCGQLSFSFGRDTTRRLSLSPESNMEATETNSIFLPAKEVLSIQNTILQSRDRDGLFGFDDTYLDLARALSVPEARGRKIPEFGRARKLLKEFLGGRVVLDHRKQRWTFRQGGSTFSIGTTSEGVKKAAILATLLGNQYLTRDSAVFIDEPESALHPAAISTFMDVIRMLSSCGMQIFLATHSYFVIKKMFVLSTRHDMAVGVLSMHADGVDVSDMRNGMPKNAIIDESVRLYDEEVECAMGGGEQA